MTLQTLSDLHPGFSDPVMDSQQAFRTILRAMSHPGIVLPFEHLDEVPLPLNRAAGAVCLTLLDFETVLWVDFFPSSGALSWLRFHCGCPLENHSSLANFALITDTIRTPPFELFYAGREEEPGSSTTLILQVEDLYAPGRNRLRGPGIEREHSLEVVGLHENFWDSWESNHLLYPLGVDVLLCADRKIAGLPRTIRVDYA